MKILTMCRAGLSRSLALADVLKFHFSPADVIPVGFDTNSPTTLQMMIDWADKVVLMREKFADELSHRGVILPDEKKMVCEVGPDVHGYAGPGRAVLIDMVWRWARKNMPALGVTEGQGGSFKTKQW